MRRWRGKEPSIPDKVLAVWKKINRLDGGGQSDTFEMAHRENGSPAVLKLPKLKDEIARERFKREVRILREIEHPNIVRLFNSDVEDEPYYYLTPFGEPLDKWWSAPNVASVAEAQRIIRALLEGLAYFHAGGGVHRDIKPGNVIMLKGDDGTLRPVLIDFGLAHTTGDGHLTPSSHLVNNKFAAAPASLYSVYENPAMDCLGIACLWAWMLADDPSNGYGRYHWRYHIYDRSVPDEYSQLVRAVMAKCSIESLWPENAQSMLATLDHLGLTSREESPMEQHSTVSVPTLAQRAAEAYALKEAEKLLQLADEADRKEATAAFVAPLVRELAQGIERLFSRAQAEGLPVKPEFPKPPFGEDSDPSRLLPNGLSLGKCFCGFETAGSTGPRTLGSGAGVMRFSIGATVTWAPMEERLLPFIVSLSLHTSKRVVDERAAWDKEGQLWIGFGPLQRIPYPTLRPDYEEQLKLAKERAAGRKGTIDDLLTLIEGWLFNAEYWTTLSFIVVQTATLVAR